MEIRMEPDRIAVKIRWKPDRAGAPALHSDAVWYSHRRTCSRIIVSVMLMYVSATSCEVFTCRYV